MVFVRLIREEKGKITCEELNLYHGICQGIGIDRIIVSNNPINSERGYRVTSEDFDSLYNKKANELTKEIESRKNEQEAENKKELEELRLWKSEIEGKNFVRQIIAIWRWRRRAKA